MLKKNKKIKIKVKASQIPTLSHSDRILGKEEKNIKLQTLFAFYFNRFYINQQRGDSEQLENLARRRKYILLIKKIRWNFLLREKLTNVRQGSFPRIQNTKNN